MDLGILLVLPRAVFPDETLPCHNTCDIHWINLNWGTPVNTKRNVVSFQVELTGPTSSPATPTPAGGGAGARGGLHGHAGRGEQCGQLVVH